MKKLSFLLFILTSTVFFACKKDVAKTLMTDMTAPEILTPATSTTALVLDSADKADAFVVTWKKAENGVASVIKYEVEVDTAGNDFNSAESFGTSTTGEVQKTILDLNNVLLDLGLPTKTPSTVQIRISATFGSDVVYSNPISLIVQPWSNDVIVIPVLPALYVAGDFQGWDIANAMRISALNDGVNIYEGYINIAGGTREFKAYTLRDWGSTSYGTTAGNTIEVANYAGANFAAPAVGYYQFVINLTSMQFTLSPTTWAIIGDATTGGWNSDTQMAYNATTKLWTVTADMTSGGSWKFRANNAWALNFGIKAGKLTYADHPFGLGNSGVDNITVPSNGNYTITLDLSDANNYKYTAVKN